MKTDNVKFSAAELSRYNRHIIIPEFGLESQRKLKHAKVLIVGAGGLGSPALLYLAAAGVGTIGIVDYDVVEDSNLHRQVLFTVSSVGRSKAAVAKRKLLALNPHVSIVTHNMQLTAENAIALIEQYDVVADGTDNFPTRYLINDACVLLGKVNVYASIFQFEGQVSVFNYENKDGTRGPNYRDLFASPPPADLVPNCAEAGVLGVLPGIIGSMQALEVIKVITGIGNVLDGRLFLFDALTFESRMVNIRHNGHNPLTGKNPTISKLIDYEQFCGVKAIQKKIKELSVLEFSSWQKRGDEFQLIDVREPFEYEIVNMGGHLIPLGGILEHASEISRDRKVVVHCRMGGRSVKAIRELEDKVGFENLYNLTGGIISYIDEVERSLTKY
jgi:adenylyltransferase/sulfurtransferase